MTDQRASLCEGEADFLKTDATEFGSEWISSPMMSQSGVVIRYCALFNAFSVLHDPARNG